MCDYGEKKQKWVPIVTGIDIGLKKLLLGQFISYIVLPVFRQSSSRSRSPSPITTAKFITSFGGDSSDDEGGIVQGPALPPHLQTNPKEDSSLKFKQTHTSRSVSFYHLCLRIWQTDTFQTFGVLCTIV